MSSFDFYLSSVCERARMRTRGVFYTFRAAVSILFPLDIIVVCRCLLCSCSMRARMRTRGVFRTSRRSVIHHLHLLSSAGVFFLRVVSARACAHAVFYTCRAAASILFCGASPGPLLGFSWAYPESSWAPQGLFWASLGSLLGLSWVLETCPNYERGCFVSQITAPKSLRVQGVGFVLQNTAPNASP